MSETKQKTDTTCNNLQAPTLAKVKDYGTQCMYISVVTITLRLTLTLPCLALDVTLVWCWCWVHAGPLPFGTHEAREARAVGARCHPQVFPRLAGAKGLQAKVPAHCWSQGGSLHQNCAGQYFSSLSLSVSVSVSLSPFVVFLFHRPRCEYCCGIFWLSAHKVKSGEEKSTATCAGIRTHNLSVTSPALLPTCNSGSGFLLQS